MSINSEVLVIGPKRLLLTLGVADYPDDWYDDVSPDAIIIGTAFNAETSEQSCQVANVCGVGLDNLGKHRVLAPEDAYPDDEELHELYVKLVQLTAQRKTQVWFRPNC